MADHTHIEWTDATWNVVTGCSVVSPGCTNCYAMRLAGTRLRHHPSRAGLTVDSKAGQASSSAKRDRPAKHVWNGQVRFNEAWLTQPLRWRRPRRIFVAAHGDLFHEGVTDDQLDRIFAVMALCPQHTFQVLTKRPERMRAYLTGEYSPALGRNVRPHLVWQQAFAINRAAGRSLITFTRRLEDQGCAARNENPWPLRNVWLGVSVEDQARADERIPLLLDTPAAVRWISAEPLLGPVDLMRIQSPPSWRYQPLWGRRLNPFAAAVELAEEPTRRIDWVVAGGESGPGARPMHPDWARQLRDQCANAGVPFLFKQWGDWLPWLQFNEARVVDDGEQTRFDTVIWQNGRWEQLGRPSDLQVEDDYGGGASGPDDPDQILGRVGKAAAGRLLDGQLHDAYPATSAARG